MKKILPILVVGFLILGGLGAMAFPDKHTKEEQLLQEPQLVVRIKGGILGYTVSVKNVGNEKVIGNLSMNITTDPNFLIIGNELSHDGFKIDLDAGQEFGFRWGPVIGFGPATINVLGVFSPGGWGFTAEANGFVLLFYVLVKFDPIPIP